MAIPTSRTTTTATPPDTQAPTAPSRSDRNADIGERRQPQLDGGDRQRRGHELPRRALRRARPARPSTQVGSSATPSFGDTGLASCHDLSVSCPRHGCRRPISAATPSIANASRTRCRARSASSRAITRCPSGTQGTLAAPFLGTQGAGNLNVVVVGWNDSTAQVQTVADSAGNTYALAAGPIVSDGVASQAIYYAKNIAAPAAVRTP